MEESHKKAWMAPNLTVLIRSGIEENTLMQCKSNEGSGAGVTAGSCYWATCLSSCNAFVAS